MQTNMPQVGDQVILEVDLLRVFPGVVMETYPDGDIVILIDGCDPMVVQMTDVAEVIHVA
jgi:hypothetical protein